MTLKERKEQVRSYLGKSVTIKIDRPIGYVHKQGNSSLTYPVNYGYIPGEIGGDGEYIDVYLLGISEPVESYTAKIIGIVHRENDTEDKLVAAPEGIEFTAEEIKAQVDFQERYFETYIETESLITVLLFREGKFINPPREFREALGPRMAMRFNQNRLKLFTFSEFESICASIKSSCDLKDVRSLRRFLTRSEVVNDFKEFEGYCSKFFLTKETIIQTMWFVENGYLTIEIKDEKNIYKNKTN